MIIKKDINNNVQGITIIEESGKEYFLIIEDIDLNKTDEEQKQIALIKYNEIKLIEAQRV